MRRYCPELWSDPVFYAVAITSFLTFCIIVAGVHCRDFSLLVEVKDSDSNSGYFMITSWIPIGFYLTWMAITTCFAISSIFAYRAIFKVAFTDVLPEYRDKARDDSNRILGAIFLNLFLMILFSAVFYLFRVEVFGFLIMALTVIGIGYQAGLTAKWGKYIGNSQEPFTNLKGATWILFPTFFLITMSTIMSFVLPGRR